MALAGKNLELAMRIRADLQQAIGELKQMESAVEANGRQAETTNRGMEKLGSTIGKVAAAIAGGAVYKAVISATIEQERVTAQLEQRLRSTGGAAGLTRDELLDMASAMQQVTTYGDEAVIPAQSLLLTFTKIGREVFPRALETVLDMSTALGQDLKSSAVQLGKALNDPIQGVSALSKVGVQFTEQQKEQIKTLVESGRVMDAQKIILSELETQMGGSARAARDTLCGSIEALKNAFGDLLEGDTGSEGLIGAREAIEELTRVMSDPQTKEAFGVLIGLVASLTTVAADATVAMADLFANISASIDSISGDLDPLRRLGVEIRTVERALKGGLDTPFKYLLTSDTELQQIKNQLETERDLILAARGQGKPTPPPAITGGAGVEDVVVVNKEYEKLLGNLQKQVDMFGITSEAARVRYAIERGELGKLDGDQQQALLRYAQEIDAKRASAEASKAAGQATQQQTRQQQQYVLGLERSAAMVGLSTDQVRAYELAEKGLAGALRDRAIAAQAVIAAEERKQQLDADARQIAGLRAQLLRAEGRDAEALTIEIEQRYGELMKRLQANGDTAGLAIIDGLVNVEQAQIRFNEIQRQFEQIQAEQSRQEQSVQAQQQAGLLSEVGARERILEIHRATGDKLQELRPALLEMAQMPGAIGESAQRILDNLDAQAANLRNTLSLLQETLRTALESGLANALTGLARGTMTLREAVSALGQSVLDALTQMAAKNLAQSIAGSLFGGGNDAASLTSGATAVTSSAGALSAAGATLLTGAAALQASAAAIAAANGVAGASSVAGAATSGAANSSWLSSAASWAGSFFAEGGHVRGPGTGTSDSIPAWLSDYEFVTRAAVVTQPGALTFLNDFNTRGMAALNDWSYRVRHNTGGLAGVPAPALPAPGRPGGRMAEPAASMSATLKNSQTFNLIDSPERIADVLNSPAGDQAFTVMLSRDPAKFRTILGL